MMIRLRSSVVALLVLSVAAPAAATNQGLLDLDRAKALDKCHIVIGRTGSNFAVKKLKSLANCTDGVLKCLQTKPGVQRCLDQARARCEEQLLAGAAAEATLVDAVVRKCGSDVALADLLDPAGLDLESLRDQCSQRFGLTLADLTAAGTCLARQQACELERLFAVVAPRAASLLVVAGVDPAARSALGCLTNHGGSNEHVDDARNVGRAVERCARAVENAGLKLVDASLKAVGRCLDTLFTCVQVKNNPATAPACVAKAQKRCDVEFANLAAAATRPRPALQKACGSLDYDTLRSAEGLRLAALDAECETPRASAGSTLAAYADCLVRSHGCGVGELARFKSPRAEALLTSIGRSLQGTLCPSSNSATPTPSDATATPSDPPATTTPTPPVATATGPTPTPTPGCADPYEPNAFPGSAANLNGQCNGTCTDDGYDLLVEATIDSGSDNDFYVFDVVDLPGHSFSLQTRLSRIPDDSNYDLYLYRLDGGVFTPLDQSTNDGTGSEAANYPGATGDNSGQYGVEVRRVSGSSCDSYRLTIENPS